MAVFLVTKKEIRDHVQSKRFLMIFGALLLVVILSMSQGVGEYNDALDQYKEMSSRIGEGEGVWQFMPEKPSVLLIFETMTSYFIPIGAVLAIAMGFDLISGEKEEGSLKSLLSHPLFRDNIIIGKLCGALAVLGLVMVIVTFTSTGVLMMYGISPSSNEFLRILIYMGFSLLFMLAFFSIAMLSSTLAKSSGLSVAYCIGIVLVLSFMVPYVGAAVAEEYAGEEPSKVNFMKGGMPLNKEMTEAEREEQQEEMQEYQVEYQEYWDKRTGIERIFTIFSPNESYEEIANEITGGSDAEETEGVFRFKVPGERDEKSIGESMGLVLPEILSLLMISVVMLIGAYLTFMRLDIR
jgi:ABC-2 type transport system permease protein